MTSQELVLHDDRMRAEITKLAAETVKLNAEARKLAAEQAKMSRERWYYPIVVLGGLFAAAGVMVKFLGT